jgi:hypothetical protein
VIQVRPGDFVLSARWGPVSRLVRRGQQRNARRVRLAQPHTHWSHAALVVSSAGDLVEVIRGRARYTHLRDFAGTDHTIVHIEATDAERAAAVRFARHCAEQGHRLGWLALASQAVSSFTGSKLCFFIDDTHTCSGLVARALERTGAIFDRSPSHVAPADLAAYYGVNGGKRDPCHTGESFNSVTKLTKLFLPTKKERSPRVVPD